MGCRGGAKRVLSKWIACSPGFKWGWKRSWEGRGKGRCLPLPAIGPGLAAVVRRDLLPLKQGSEEGGCQERDVDMG